MAVVLFDLDGVLIDSEALKARSHAATVADFGGHVDPLFYATVMGRDHAAVRAAFLDQGAIPHTPPEDYSARYRSHYETLVDAELAPTPGALDLLDALAASEHRVGLVTSSQGWMVDRVFARLPLANYFAQIVSADDVERHKPHPDSYLLAMKKFEAAPDLTVIFEDSAAGIEAAVRSGAATIGIRHAFNHTHAFTGVARTIDSLGTAAKIMTLIETLASADSESGVLRV